MQPIKSTHEITKHHFRGGIAMVITDCSVTSITWSANTGLIGEPTLHTKKSASNGDHRI